MKSVAMVIRSFLAIAVTLVGASCNQSPEPIVYTGPDFVFLDSKPLISVYENQSTPLLIPVKVNLKQSENIEVTFEVIGENILEGSDYLVKTGSPVKIPRNKYEASISIQVINNEVIQSEKRRITVRIKSVNSPNLKLQIVQEVQIELLDDDCDPSVPKVALWTGDVSIQGGSSNIDSGIGEGGPGGICGGSLVVNGDFFGSANPSSRMTVLMNQNSGFPTKGIASVVRYPLFEGSTFYEYEASGTYDETVKSITLNFTVYSNDNPPSSFTGTHIITPK